jgi:hypothetical protein
MKILTTTSYLLFLALVFVQDSYASVTYNFEGTITSAHSGCSQCDPIPAGQALYSIAVGDTFTGTLTWDYNPATAVSPYPGIVDAYDWFSFLIDFNGVTFFDSVGGVVFLKEGGFNYEDEGPSYSVAAGLYMGLPDAFRMFFNDTTYTPAAGLPVNLDFSTFDSITVGVSALLDYSWDIEGAVTSYSVVPVTPTPYLFGSGLLGLLGIARRKKAEAPTPAL